MRIWQTKIIGKQATGGEQNILECDAVQAEKILPTFRRNVLLPSS
jgi:hypothetical protein